MMTTLRPELLDELLSGYEKPEELLGEEGCFAVSAAEDGVVGTRALGAELSAHPGYEKGDSAGRGTGNSRNGYSAKTILTDEGELDLAVPRDRNGTFEPLIVPKGERRPASDVVNDVLSDASSQTQFGAGRRHKAAGYQ